MAAARDTGVLTVAAVRKVKGKGTQFLFNERHAIYTIRSGTKLARTGGRRLRAALEEEAPVKVVLNPRQGDHPAHHAAAGQGPRAVRGVAELPRQAHQAEGDRHRRTRPHALQRGRHRAEVAGLPPLQEDRAELPQGEGDLRLLRRPVLPPRRADGGHPVHPVPVRAPTAATPGAQDVPDHRDRFGYCCEKVFSFANENNDVLAVRADKWGGCCVQWWYHVAPLIRVRFKIGSFSIVLALVIDPGMFDKPVLLTTCWPRRRTPPATPTRTCRSTRSNRGRPTLRPTTPARSSRPIRTSRRPTRR